MLIGIIDFQTDPLSSFIICAIGFVVLMAIYYHFTRWMLSINKRIENQEKQIALLEKIAAKLDETPAG